MKVLRSIKIYYLSGSDDDSDRQRKIIIPYIVRTVSVLNDGTKAVVLFTAGFLYFFFVVTSLMNELVRVNDNIFVLTLFLMLIQIPCMIMLYLGCRYYKKARQSNNVDDHPQ